MYLSSSGRAEWLLSPPHRILFQCTYLLSKGMEFPLIVSPGQYIAFNRKCHFIFKDRGKYQITIKIPTDSGLPFPVSICVGKEMFPRNLCTYMYEDGIIIIMAELNVVMSSIKLSVKNDSTQGEWFVMTATPTISIRGGVN